MNKLTGEYNNFQQYWKENTEETMHRSKSNYEHEHLHLVISEDPNSKNHLLLKTYKGRNKTTPHKEALVSSSELLSGQVINPNDLFKHDLNTLHISGMGLTGSCIDEPYQFLRCRYFSGWIQYPEDLNSPDELTDVRGLTLHDQGDVAGVVINGQNYCVELTQLVYAHTISIMKLAVYDESPTQLGINSRAISYTWTNPEAKRLGINLRNIISGWTYIEPGYLSSNNLTRSEE